MKYLAIKKNGKWFEPRSFSRLCGLIVRVTMVNVTNNSPSRDYSHPDDQTTQTIFNDVRCCSTTALLISKGL